VTADNHGRHASAHPSDNTIAGDDVISESEGAGSIAVSGRRKAPRTASWSRWRSTPDGSTTLDTMTTTVSGGVWHIDLPPRNASVPRTTLSHHRRRLRRGRQSGAEATRAITSTPVHTSPVDLATGRDPCRARWKHRGKYRRAIWGYRSPIPMRVRQRTTTLSVSHGTLTVAALGGAAIAGSGTARSRSTAQCGDQRHARLEQCRVPGDPRLSTPTL